MNLENELFARGVGNHDANKLTHKGLAAFAIVFLLILVVAGPWITYKPAPFTGEGSPLRQYTYLLVFGLTIYVCRLRDYPSRIRAIPLSLGIALAYCWISLLWSDAAGIALRRLILTTIIVWTIFAAIRLVGFDQTMKSMRQVMLYVLILNFAVSIAIPSIGVHGFGFADSADTGLIGDWRGVMIQKNFAGAFCAITALTYLFCNRDMRPLLRWGVILGSVIFLLKTNSKTSMGLLGLSIVLGWLFAVYNPRYRLLAIPVVVLTGSFIAVLAASNWDALMAPFQSDDALTGRVQIWPVLIAYWQENKWFGTGYGSFWNIGSGSPVFKYVGATNWVGELGNGHNGYLDLLVTVGIPGLTVIVLMVFYVPLVKLFSIVHMDGNRRGYLLAMVIFCALHNFTESSLFDRDAIANIFLMIALALLEVAEGPKPLPLVAHPIGSR